MIKRPRLRRVLAHAARGRVNLSVAAGCMVAAWIAGSGWLVVLACAAYATLVTWSACSPWFWHHVRSADHAAQRRLPEASDLTDPALRQVVSAILDARIEVSRVLKLTPVNVRAHVHAALASLDELEAYAAHLVRNAEGLVGYLRRARRDKVELEIERLGQLAEHAIDRDTRSEYEAARATRLEQLRALDQVTREHGRMLASLQRVVAAVEALPSQIFRMRVLENQAREDVPAELGEELARMSGELTASRQTLEALIEAPHGLPMPVPCPPSVPMT
jgi:hypothetical protein